MNKLAMFGYVMEVYSHGNLSLFSENFRLVSQRKFVRPITIRKVVEVSHWWVRGRSAVGTIMGEVVIVFRETEVSSAMNNVCDC
jgi:hypothetical protein